MRSKLSPFPARRAWLSLFLVALLCGFVVLAYHLRAIFTPLLVALGIAYMVNPLVTWLETKRVSRTASIVGLYAVALGGIAMALLFVVPALVIQGTDFFEETLVGERILDDKNGDGLWDPGDEFEDANDNQK